MKKIWKISYEARDVLVDNDIIDEIADAAKEHEASYFGFKWFCDQYGWHDWMNKFAEGYSEEDLEVLKDDPEDDSDIESAMMAGFVEGMCRKDGMNDVKMFAMLEYDGMADSDIWRHIKDGVFAYDDYDTYYDEMWRCSQPSNPNYIMDEEEIQELKDSIKKDWDDMYVIDFRGTEYHVSFLL